MLRGDRPVELEESLAECREGRRAQHGASHIEDRRGRDVAVLRRNGAIHGDETACLRLLLDGVEEPRLADAGLAREEQEVAMAANDIVEASIDEVEEVVPSDQERAANDAEGA
jgi:tRNA A-37 threonylcarbamoyl transferase component Bud32